jgi:hypothetical protein
MGSVEIDSTFLCDSVSLYHLSVTGELQLIVNDGHSYTDSE